jgi:threonine synthase
MDLPRLTDRLAHVAGLRCVLSDKNFGLEEVTYTNPEMGEVATLDVIYHYDHAQKVMDGPLTMWKQRDLLPLVEGPPLGLSLLGGTPLIPYTILEPLASALGVRGVCIKNDGASLTGSLKDRASAMVVAHAVQNLGQRVIATASTGNAAAALAGVCAAIGNTQAVIFVPSTAPEGKIAQMLVFGATVILVDGDYDTAFDLCKAACQEFGWYNRSTGINPFTSEGKKTVVFEIAEQLAWEMPDAMVISVGDGSIIGSTYKGLHELYLLGWIDKMPRLIGVQAAGSDALVYAWENNLTAQTMGERPAHTIADSISSRLPRDRAKALRAVRDSRGAFLRVTDEEILQAIPELARQTGIFTEPAAAATFAGLKVAKQSNLIHSHERVLLLITGNGLKDVRSAMQSVNQYKPLVISPHLSAVRDYLQHQIS